MRTNTKQEGRAEALPSLVFAHANSYGAGCYSKLFADLRLRGMSVAAPALLGHAPAYPVTNNWPHLVEELAAFISEKIAGDAQLAPHGKSAQAPILVGHSLGGVLSLMVAALYPAMASGVVLLDSPVLVGWKARALRAAKRMGMMASMSPSRVSKKRRIHWNSVAEARAWLISKPTFSAWDEDVLEDYIKTGLRTTANGCELVFDRNVESNIYDGFPDNLGALLKKNPLHCWVSFIGGTHSKEMRQAGTEATHRVAHGRILMLDGSHLFPMESPIATAAAIEASVRNMHKNFGPFAHSQPRASLQLQ